MSYVFDGLRDVTVLSTTVRMVLAVLCGGIIGIEREYKRRPAGFRTHILICLGATMTTLTSQFLYLNMHYYTDMARLGAQVVAGMGFIGAGTIIVTRRQRVKGLTTAAGLWASACMGLAIGAGFDACVLPGLVLICLCVRVLPALEAVKVENARNMNLYIEFTSMDDVGLILGCIKAQNVDIYNVDIERGRKDRSQSPSAVFSLRLHKKRSHSQVVAAIAKLECIRMIDEI